MGSNNNSRALLQFNEYDFRHRKVLEILRQRPRSKTELVVNAVLHYVSCPEASEDFNKETIRKLIREVLLEMMTDGSIQATVSSGPHAAQAPAQELEDLGDMMSVFRGGT